MKITRIVREKDYISALNYKLPILSSKIRAIDIFFTELISYLSIKMHTVS